MKKLYYVTFVMAIIFAAFGSWMLIGAIMLDSMYHLGCAMLSAVLMVTTGDLNIELWKEMEEEKTKEKES